jgi:hypothetical protein
MKRPETQGPGPQGPGPQGRSTLMCP